MPTEKGSQLGVKVIDKISEKGNAYTVLQYPIGIQKMLVEYFICEEKPDEVETEIVEKNAWLAKIREEHAGAYMPWTDEEDRRLINEFKSGQFSTKDLSEIHGRTSGAIIARLKRLNLIE